MFTIDSPANMLNIDDTKNIPTCLLNNRQNTIIQQKIFTEAIRKAISKEVYVSLNRIFCASKIIDEIKKIAIK